MLLAGDIGGTKTSLAVYSPERGPREPLAKATFSSGKYPNLESLAQEFLGGVELPVEQASFGVAGPVIAGKARITNLPWVMEECWLADALRLPHVSLFNDLEAIAHAVPFLCSGDLSTLNAGKPARDGVRAVIAPGTGLGEAFLTWDGSRYRIHASEGGHADFAPTDELQVALLQFLLRRGEHVSYERVCSGKGLPNIYAFLKESGRCPEPPWLAEKLAGVPDPSPVIVNSALDHDDGCEICSVTLDIFVSIMGAEAGNLALKVLADGGLYIGGGIPPRILSVLGAGRFMAAFLGKGRFAALLDNIPVHVILNPEAALFGAACHGLEMAQSC